MLGLWQVLLLDILRSFLHPGCAEAVGEGGREPLQGLGKSGERLTPAAFCSHLAAAHMPALYPEEGMRDAHEKLPGAGLPPNLTPSAFGLGFIFQFPSLPYRQSQELSF